MSNSLDNHLDDFKVKCAWTLQVYFDTLSLYNENETTGFSQDMKEMIIENLVLKIYSSWEQFLENIFIDYMLGLQSDNGLAVTRYVSPIDSEHAYKIIKNITKYPDWTDIEKILINAENFFENGGSFKILRTLKANLYAIKKIRNAIAHTSKQAKLDFENLVRGKIGHLPTNITPAKFVSEYKTSQRRGSPTYFEYYIDFLKDSAIMLVEFQDNDGI